MNQIAKVETKSWTRYFNRDLIGFLVSVALAIASVFLIGPWIDNVVTLGIWPMLLNFSAAAAALATYYIAKTHYSKGAWNVMKKVFWVVILASTTIALALFSTTVMGGAASITGLVYPLTGIFIVSVAFYMISLSSETLGLLGMSGLSMFLGLLIAAGAFYGYLDYDSTILAIEFALLIILATGGVFAKLMMYLHGIRGVRNAGGGSSSNSEPEEIGLDEYDGFDEDEGEY